MQNRRILLFMLLVVCVVVDIHAIIHNVYVRSADGSPLAKVKVYSFGSRSKAEAAYKIGLKDENMRMMGLNLKNYGLLDEAETAEDGYCAIDAIPNGYLVLDAEDVDSKEGYKYEFTLCSVQEVKQPGNESTLNIVLSRQENKRKVMAAGSGDVAFVTDMGKVEKRATPVMEAMGSGVSERFGRNKIKVSKVLDIDGEYARDDARFVAFPFIVFEGKGDSVWTDSVVYMPPSVIDGKDYSMNMQRRMSFDSSRDKLDEFRFDHAMHLRSHGSERFLYSQWANVTKGTRYHIPGILWYEDYNAVYQRDSLLFSDGKEREPMRFLNWSDARKLVDIDRTKFIKRGTYEAVPNNASYNLKFEQGRANLNLNDSTTIVQRDEMLQWLSGFYGRKDGLIENIVIRGYSSPEGSMRRNRELSHSRAETIKALLKRHFPDVTIQTQFDENDNIIPWESVADYMTENMQDSMAHTYAMRIRELIADKNGFDAQWQAIRAHRDIYDYLDKNVLDPIRVVDIQANVIESKILSEDEIIERYENDPQFRHNMAPYQEYVMMCRLADEERWDELYEVSKRSYDNNKKERILRVQVQKQIAKDSIVLTFRDRAVPYPLAGYYYAMATLQRGQENLEILKPFLDDGPAGKRDVVNSLPFIVGQVLMYCQREEFDGANYLVRKYNLMSRPELTGLIMFVRCLDGQYRGKENADVRQYVMATSPMNKAVMLTALEQYVEALDVLYNEDVPQNDAKVEYMKAICLFRRQPSRVTSLDVDGYSSSVVYSSPDDDWDSEDNKSITNPSAWAAPMLEAIKLDPKNAFYLENDGYFNNAYRQMIMYFCKRTQSGVPMSKVALEYDALVRQMRKAKTQAAISAAHQ